MTDVAVIGLGGMGSRIARRFLDEGHNVIVWNRSAGKADDLVAAGARRAASPADAARSAEVVITMLADPDALRTVSEGDDGIAAGADLDTTVIEMSTVGPEAIQRLRETLDDSVGLLDAPVLGSLSEVEASKLKVFIGGPDHAVARWTPLLSVLGQTMHVGPLGSGAAAKLVANSTLLGTLSVLGEAIALGQGLGLPLDTTFDVLAVTPLGAQSERRREAFNAGDAPLRFPLSLAKKDAELVTGAAAASVEMRAAEAAREWFEAAVANRLGDADYSAILRFIARKI